MDRVSGEPVPELIWPHVAEAQPAAPRRALILAYYYPPALEVAGRRPAGLHRWLCDFGWETVVMTAEREGTPDGVIQTPDRSWRRRVRDGSAAAAIHRAAQAEESGVRRSVLRTAKRVLRHVAPWHDDYARWSYDLVPRAIEEGRRRKIDLVFVTCNPFTLAPAARAIAHALGVPYVVDLRDALPAYLQYTAPSRHWFYRSLRDVSALTATGAYCVTSEVRAALGARPAYVILSGAWETDPQPVRPSPTFRLLHAGMLYQGIRSPEPLWQALRVLADELPDFRRDTRVSFIGEESIYATQTPGYHAVAEMCEVLGATPYAQIVELMRESSVLLIIKGAHAVDAHATLLPAKFYDYLPFAASVLAFGGERGVLGDLLDWSGCGMWAGSVEEIVAFVREEYLCWKREGVVRRPRAAEAVQYLTQRRMAGEFAEVFHAVAEGRPAHCRTRPPWEERA